MVRRNTTLTSIKVSFKLLIRQTALDYIKRLGYGSKLFVWVPHELSETNLMDRTSKCSSNLARHKRESFLNHWVTVYDKWLVCKHVVKKAYSYKGKTPPFPSKVGGHQKKVMLCCW
ncbi:hypothetical protein TNCV_3172831 [Trichonephila clavipes]|nr:hypothetical protein TNCV_3172831 [Trichonephila clavipes]